MLSNSVYSKIFLMPFMLQKNCRKILVMVFFFGNDLEAAHDCLVLVTQNC
jgi:hypothetical protein